MNKEQNRTIEPMLSVIVLVYNHEKYVQECIDSILMQKTNFTFEIIVSDDCSTDRTVCILKDKYADMVRIVDRPENVGICRNMYEAYQIARGKYIYVCSGDDFFPIDSVFQKHVEYLEKHDDVFSVASWICFIDVNNNSKKIIDMPYTNYTLLDFLRGVPIYFFIGAMRNEFKQDNVEYLCKGGRDSDELQMVYYCLSKGKKGILPEPLYAYCKRTNANNYNSTHSFADILENYAKGFRAIESVDKGAHNFNVIKTLQYAKPIDYMLQNDGVKAITQIIHILTFKEICTFVCIKLLMKLNNRKVPKWLLDERRLVKRQKGSLTIKSQD